MKMLGKVILFLVIPITGFLLLLSGVFNHKLDPSVSAIKYEELGGVDIIQVKEKKFQSDFTVTGSVISKESANVSTKIMAEIEEIFVKEGSQVKIGDTLMILNNDQVSAQAQVASAQIESARSQLNTIESQMEEAKVGIEQVEVAYQNDKKTYNRIKNLYEKGFVSEQELDNMETKFLSTESTLKKAKASLETIKSQKQSVLAQIKSAEAGYRSANVNVENTTIRAPFTGTVVNTFMDVGDMASPGVPLLNIEQQPYFFEVYVDESKKGAIKQNDKVNVKIEALNQTNEGVVSEIEPRIDPNSRTFKVKIQLPQDLEITSGMFGHATLTKYDRVGLYVPKTAIYNWSQITAVYVLDENNVIRLRYVELGEETGDEVEVLSGLNKGERIVANQVEKVKEQMMVVESK